MAKVIAGLLILFPVLALAAPVTIEVTPTSIVTSAGGPVDGHRAYRGCDLSTQTVGALIGQITQGTPFTMVVDDAVPEQVCSRAFGAGGEGGFSNVVTISITLAPPGDTTTTYNCVLSPANGGTCSVVSQP